MVVSKMVWRVAAGMLVAVLVGCATTETQPSASVTSLAPNAQHWFRVSWTAEPDRNGERRLHGYVESSLGEAANRVQLLAQLSVIGGRWREHRHRARPPFKG